MTLSSQLSQRSVPNENRDDHVSSLNKVDIFCSRSQSKFHGLQILLRLYGYVTFHAKMCFNGFPFFNGILFRSCFKEIRIRSNYLGHPQKICTRSVETSSHSNDLLTHLVKTSICLNDLLTCSTKMSNRFNNLLTSLLKTSNHLNDLLIRSLEHPSVQTT